MVAAEPTLDVSIVLPVHNEAGHLADELARISASMDKPSEYSWELVVVDDGSTDGSAEICQGLGKVRVIKTRRNRGSGAARRIGTEAAEGRVVVWSDADMTYPNDQIPELVAELGNGDHIVGARTSEQGTFKIFRVPAKWAIRRLASYLTRTKIPDLNSGFRAFRRDVGLQFTQQLPTGFSCVTTITMAFLMNGYEVRYVPISYKARAGRSKFHWFRDTSRYVLQVIRMILTYDPLRVALPIDLATRCRLRRQTWIRHCRQGLPSRRQHSASRVRGTSSAGRGTSRRSGGEVEPSSKPAFLQATWKNLPRGSLC